MLEDAETLRRMIREEKYRRSDSRLAGDYLGVEASTARIDSLEAELRYLIGGSV